MEKNNTDMHGNEEKKKALAEESFSNTIKNAHASGDGSLKRSDETVDVPSSGPAKETPPTESY